jgi:hypothetical protein
MAAYSRFTGQSEEEHRVDSTDPLWNTAYDSAFRTHLSHGLDWRNGRQSIDRSRRASEGYVLHRWDP